MDLTWRDGAACVGTPTEWWFPAEGEQVRREALERCEACPVRADCHRHALLHEAHGVWAGLNARQRQRLRKAARIRLSTVEVEANDMALRRAAERLWAAGWTQGDIALELDVSSRTVIRWLQHTAQEAAQ